MKTLGLHNLVFLLIIFLFSTSCRDKKLEKEGSSDVIVEGTVFNFENFPDDYIIKISNYDYIKFTPFEYTANIGEDGKFRFSFTKLFSQEVSFEYGNKNITFFVVPGDSLFIELDAEEFINSDRTNRYVSKTMNISGGFKEINVYMLEYIPKYYSIQPPYNVIRNLQRNGTPEQYSQFLYNIWESNNSLLNSYISESKPSKSFIEWAKNYVDYEYAKRLINYWWMKPYDNIDIPKVYMDYFKEKLVYKSDYYCISYSFFLNEYQNLLNYNVYEETRELKKDGNYMSSYNKSIENTINNTEGFARDILLTRWLYAMLDKKRVYEFNELYSAYQDKFTDERIKLILEQKYDEIMAYISNREIPSNIILNNLVGNKTIGDIINSIVGEHPDKVLYIDVWASWCGPCKREFPFSLKLQEMFENQDIAFIYVCIETEEIAWKADILELELSGNHYLLDKNQSDVFRSELQISGIPHYILVDKQGNILNGNAERPSKNGDLNIDLISQIQILLSTK